MRSDAVVATVLATICMLFYIWIRFKNIHFALAAVMALIHDVLIVIGFYALSRVTVGTTFIACMLTIVGYSINATIVIFDRIRENKAVMKRDDKMIDRTVHAHSDAQLDKQTGSSHMESLAADRQYQRYGLSQRYFRPCEAHRASQETD